MENVSHLIEAVKKFGNLSDVCHVTTFTGSRERKDGSYQSVTVEVHDIGRKVEGRGRYSCIVKSKDGKAASGNAGDSVESALAQVHWHKLG